MPTARTRKKSKAVAAARPAAKSRPRWISVSDGRIPVRGLAWFAENRGSFSRLPIRAQQVVREPVWDLAQSPASARLAFRSNTTELTVRVTNSDTGFMSHMPLTGSSGLALYAGVPGRMRYWTTAIPDQQDPTFERQLFSGIPGKMREFRLYLPLYKPLKSLDVCVSPGARVLAPSPARLPLPVVFYGTSITQGGCASTAGSDFVSTLGRDLDLDVINLGFSGNGRGDPELAKLMTEVESALYVLDYVANADAATLRRTLPRFVKILRKARPATPILLITNLCYANYDFSAAGRSVHEEKRDIIIDFYVRQRRRGDTSIHLADGFSLIPFGVPCVTVDGGHPADHGFHLMAKRLAPVIERILLRDDQGS